MKNSYANDDVFPIIARLITDHTYRTSEFVTHMQLVQSVLSSTDGASLVAAATRENKLDEKGTAVSMVAGFSQRYTIGKNAFSHLFERKKMGSTYAYRSTQSTPTASNVTAPLVDPDLQGVEGDLKMRAHLVRERDPSLRIKKLKSITDEGKRPTCECCGFDAGTTFPGIESYIVEVHHRVPLSNQSGKTVTKLNDLAVLCPTCHRAIHRSGGTSVEDFRARFFHPVEPDSRPS